VPCRDAPGLPVITLFVQSLTALKTEILTIESASKFEQAASRAADLLSSGRLAALPTETVYGLAADAFNAEAVASIYTTKGRPSTNPLIVHVADKSMLLECVREWPEIAEKFSQAFWPGPLTLVLPKSDRISDNITAGLDSVAVRWPGHPFMRAVIKNLGRPIAAPSANLANQLSPTSAEHVQAQLKGRIPLIVDGGAANVGIESTVLDLCGRNPTVLRPGIIHLESLRAVAPNTMHRSAQQSSGAQKSPGLHHKHYAPKARVIILDRSDSSQPNDLINQIRRLGILPAEACVLGLEDLPSPADFLRVCFIPHDPEAYARALYAELFLCDQLGPKWIVVEAVPDTPAWEGVRDRLARAAGDE
jgi:L-threonylcarbamoyladenylate synthase